MHISSTKWVIGFVIPSILLLGLFLGFYLWLNELQKKAEVRKANIRLVESMGGEVLYDYQHGSIDPNSAKPGWLASLFGKDLFCSVVAIRFGSDENLANELKDLKIIQKFPKLESLMIFESQVSDFTPLSKMQSLEFVSISKSPIQDLEWVKGMKKLDFLSIETHHLKSLKGIETAQNLKSLFIGQYSFNETQKYDIKDLELIQNLTKTSNIGGSIGGTGRFFILEKTSKTKEPQDLQHQHAQSPYNRKARQTCYPRYFSLPHFRFNWNRKIFKSE